jgi:hypothetical protein
MSEVIWPYREMSRRTFTLTTLSIKGLTGSFGLGQSELKTRQRIDSHSHLYQSPPGNPHPLVL